MLNMKKPSGIASIVYVRISFMLAVMKLDLQCLQLVHLTVIVLHVRLFAPCLGGVKYQLDMAEDQKIKMMKSSPSMNALQN